MTQIVCSTSVCPVGCTFLDWSLHYLSGKTHFYHYNLGLIPLVDNPVQMQQHNAHAHCKNHPAGLEATQHCVEILSNTENFATLYPVAPHVDKIRAKLPGLDITAYQQLRKQEYQDTMHWLSQQGIKIIFVSLNDSLQLYSIYQPRDLTNHWTNEKFNGKKDIWNYFARTFFGDSLETFQSQNLNDIWDMREFYALNLRPMDQYSSAVNLDFDHHWIDSQELWFNGKHSIPDIMSKLNIELDKNRYEPWCRVFEQWQTSQIKLLQFQWQCTHIVDSVINDWSFDIDLTFEQEVVIQHLLIYKHNLNLKTWQLSKFPNNTKLLHQLLEPNQHQLNYTL